MTLYQVDFLCCTLGHTYRTVESDKRSCTFVLVYCKSHSSLLWIEDLNAINVNVFIDYIWNKKLLNNNDETRRKTFIWNNDLWHCCLVFYLLFFLACFNSWMLNFLSLYLSFTISLSLSSSLFLFSLRRRRAAAIARYCMDTLCCCDTPTVEWSVVKTMKCAQFTSTQSWNIILMSEF